jgi:transcriptional regulator with XRE-family HTH domain
MWSKADFGQAIVFIAEKLGLNQKKLASALHVKPKTISAWKRGDRRPNRGAMQALPDQLRCTMAELESIAAYHSLWRGEMEGRKSRRATGAARQVPADMISEPPAEYHLDDEDWERRFGRAVAEVARVWEERRRAKGQPPGASHS